MPRKLIYDDCRPIIGIPKSHNSDIQTPQPSVLLSSLNFVITEIFIIFAYQI